MSEDKDSKKAVLHRLHRIEGQVRGIIRMVEEGKDCEEVLNQIAAVRSAMESVGVQIITRRMKECLQSDVASPCDEAVGEAIDSFLRFTHSMRT
jgi:DNA-binding FrmR family transcriptional regulator